MKPFGAAQIIEHALSTSQHLVSGENGERLALFFLVVAEDHFDKLVSAVSARYLLSALGIFGSIEGQTQTYGKVWRTWMAEALKLSSSQQIRIATLTGLISQDKASGLARESPILQDTIYVQAIETLSGESDAWGLLDAACVNRALDQQTGRKLVTELVQRLSKEGSQPGPILKMLEIIAKSSAALFSEEPIRTELVSQLLALSEINDSTVSSKVVAIRSLLDAETRGKLPVVDIIQSSLDRAGAQSLG
jgi:hypothetical protein